MPYLLESVFDDVSVTADSQKLTAPHVTFRWVSLDTPPEVVVHGMANIEKAKEIHLHMPGMEIFAVVRPDSCPPVFPNMPWLETPHHHLTVLSLNSADRTALAQICKTRADHQA